MGLKQPKKKVSESLLKAIKEKKTAGFGAKFTKEILKRRKDDKG